MPENVVKTMEMAWERKIKNSEALKKYGEQRSSVITPIYGKEAQDEDANLVAVAPGKDMLTRAVLFEPLKRLI